MVEFPLRGEVYWTDFDPVTGSEVGKTRPAVIVQNDDGNEHSSTTIVAAISSRYAHVRFPFVVPLPEGAMPRRSVVNCAQLRTVDKARLHPGCVVRLNGETMAAVDGALRRSLGL